MCIIFQRQEWQEFNGASKGFSMLCKKKNGGGRSCKKFDRLC
jgi:hypothetical protein